MVEEEWKHPLMLLAKGSDIPIQKPKSEWDETEKTNSMMNIKTLNSLVTAVSDRECHKIINCPTAKQAWEALAMSL